LNRTAATEGRVLGGLVPDSIVIGSSAPLPNSHVRLSLAQAKREHARAVQAQRWFASSALLRDPEADAGRLTNADRHLEESERFYRDLVYRLESERGISIL
jgi:hypothetical protein